MLLVELQIEIQYNILGRDTATVCYVESDQTAGVGLVLVPGGEALEAATTAAYSGDQHCSHTADTNTTHTNHQTLLSRLTWLSNVK